MPVPEQGGARRAPDDPVRDQAGSPLEPKDRALRPLAEVAVHARRREAATREQELQDGDVPADLAASEVAPPEERPAEPPERAPRPRSGEAVGAQPVGALEGADPSSRERAGDTVDRAPVEAVRAERDLKAGNLRVRDRRGRSGKGERDRDRGG